MRIIKLLVVSVLGAISTMAHAVTLESISPQGTVKEVYNIKAMFAESAIALGRNDSVDPFFVKCNDPSIKGKGRWVDSKVWQYDFNARIAAAVTCDITVNTAFQDPKGKPIAGAGVRGFFTGPPTIDMMRPWKNETIDEDQVFTVRYNSHIKEQSLLDKTVCLVEGVGEQIPVRLVSEKDRAELLKIDSFQRYVEEEDGVKNIPFTFFQCERNFPSGSKVSIVMGAGIQSTTGVGTQGKPVITDYVVREPFAAKLNCERPNDKAACSPLGDVQINFNGLISASDAKSVKLTVNGQSIEPKENGNSHSSMSSILFTAPFEPNAEILVTLPKGLRDDAGRPLSNADKFPLKSRFGDMPALLKFSSGSFGVIETYADVAPGQPLNQYPVLIPLTVRNVERDLKLQGISLTPGQVSTLKLNSDLEVRRWLDIVEDMQTGLYTVGNISRILNNQNLNWNEKNELVDVRNYSMFDLSTLAAQIKPMQLPSLAESKNQAEVIGVPVSEPGFYILEAISPMLGKELTKSAKPMYVRTAVLVTNMAVHFKKGDTNSLVWVTRLDDSKPIANADVNIVDCNGKNIAKGKTNNDGIYLYPNSLPEVDRCSLDNYAYMVSARIGADHPMSNGYADYSFVNEYWNNGIQSWMFNLGSYTDEYSGNKGPQLISHTVLDRTLFRAGETVSMKHFIRLKTEDGLVAPVAGRDVLPNTLVITFNGTGDRIEIPLSWKKTIGGSQEAETLWQIPKNATNGSYTTTLAYIEGDRVETIDEVNSAHFRVEEFKLPLLTGRIQLSSDKQLGSILIKPEKLKTNIQLNYIVGGGAGVLPVRVSAMALPSSLSANNLDGFDFSRFEKPSRHSSDESGNSRRERIVFLDKKEITLNADGNAELEIDHLPALLEPTTYVVEVSFMDPNGQEQTLSQNVTVMPASVFAGVRSSYVYEPNSKANFSVATIDAQGRVKPNTPVSVNIKQTKSHVVRKRLIGGFYSYDYSDSTTDLGTVCSGTTNQFGILDCALDTPLEGNLELGATTMDENQNSVTTLSDIWLFKGARWWRGNDTDRVDIISDKKEYQAGEEATFSVRIPFKNATALVAIERKGIIDYRIIQFADNGSDFKLKIEPQWAPNAFVSVLSLRGRIRGEVDDKGVAWGKSPDESGGANALIDLAKPSFRFGISPISIIDSDKRLTVTVNLDKPEYQIRQKAKASIKASLVNGQPASKANVAVFVVDKALLELSTNQTSDLFDAMQRKGALAVETATVQGRVVGRRHYGRKAVPAGGGGGMANTRELFDTLLLWQSNIVLNDLGEAEVEIPLNDSITKFEVVAVVDYGLDRFGTGKADFASNQDLQLISGLPLKVRDSDRYQAMVTVRNGTTKEAKIVVNAGVVNGNKPALSLPPQTVNLAGGTSQTLVWNIDPISLIGRDTAQTLSWTFDATDGANMRDRISVKQELLATVPVTVRQSELLGLKAGSPATSLPIQVQASALKADNKLRGGIQMNLQTSLVSSLDNVRRYFMNYPYSCFEQRASVALGLNSADRWQALISDMDSYLDENGLLLYFPSNQFNRYGSPLLTAYVLSIAQEAKGLGRDLALPAGAREAMLNGLQGVISGRIRGYDWIASDERFVVEYRLNLIAALARYNLASRSMLDGLTMQKSYSSMALVDLYTVLRSLKSYPQKDAFLAKIRTQLLQYMDRTAQQMVFHGKNNDYWAFMLDANSLQAKLLLATANDPAWAKDIPYLTVGLMKMQNQGQWGTTTANLWGTLATSKYSSIFEKQTPTGSVNMTILGSDYAEPVEWKGLDLKQKVFTPWKGNAQADLSLELKGKGQVWAVLNTLAAIPLSEPVYAGYTIKKTIEPVSQRSAGQWSSGDVYKVKMEIQASSDMTWVVVNDPIPSGSTILGSGLGRDSAIDDATERVDWWSGPTFIERKSEVYRAYYGFMPNGKTSLEYNVRLNTAGEFVLPATRVEAMYAKDFYGEIPNSPMSVQGKN